MLPLLSLKNNCLGTYNTASGGMQFTWRFFTIGWDLFYLSDWLYIPESDLGCSSWNSLDIPRWYRSLATNKIPGTSLVPCFGVPEKVMYQNEHIFGLHWILNFMLQFIYSHMCTHSLSINNHKVAHSIIIIKQHKEVANKFKSSIYKIKGNSN